MQLGKCGAVGALSISLALSTSTLAGSLPQVSSGPRPGPDLLYAPLATSPILENRPPWQAPPLLVSGAEGYAAGEYLFQDFIFDSYGANTTNVPEDPPDTAPSSTTGAAAGMTGDVVYPTNAAVYGFDAADLLEFRTRLVPGGVAYRITLNTMLVPDAAIIAIGIDTDRNGSTGANDWGHGIGSLGPLGLEHVLVTWGSGAELDGTPVPSSADTLRNQIHVEVPLAPGTATWRHYVVLGIRDASTGGFAPIQEQPTATQPGGAHLMSPPPIFNVGFRFNDEEPMGTDPSELGGRGAYGWGYWRDHGQAKALAARDISAYSADIDFGMLAAGTTDLRIPQTGYFSRLVVSRLDFPEGVDVAADRLGGSIQPYGIYVPTTYVPGTPNPVTPALHSAAANYNQYGAGVVEVLEALGEARGAIMFTPEARGPTVGYSGIGEVDTFEVWADVAHHYALDPEHVALTGESMGAIGSYRLGSLYPDLFGKVFPIAGHGGGVDDIPDNLRNLPMLMWNGIPDELIPVAEVVAYQQLLFGLGYRHLLSLFPTRDHLVHPIGAGMDFSEAAIWIGESPVDRNPSHVTYRRVPSRDDGELGLVYDHAYWVSDIEVATGAASGLVDARSHATGEGDPEIIEISRSGDRPELHLEQGIEWNPTSAPVRNALDVALEGVVGTRLWIERASIDVDASIALHFESDGPTTLELAAPWPGPVLVQRDGIPDGTRFPADGAIEISDAGAHDYVLAPDVDGDGVSADADNCPFAFNPGQEDSGGIDTTAPDGIGNACQCGDVTGDGVVNGQDGVFITRHGLGYGDPLFMVPGNCDVTGNGLCNGQDGTFVTRAALGFTDPVFVAPQGQNCPNARGWIE